jgi:predicted GIY-YIG superfamily endonuclease
MAIIYILRLERPLGNERHRAEYYIGSTQNKRTFKMRMYYHSIGQGAAFTRAAVERGISWTVVATLAGERELEQRLKRMKNTARIVRNLQQNPDWRPK